LAAIARWRALWGPRRASICHASAQACPSGRGSLGCGTPVDRAPLNRGAPGRGSQRFSRPGDSGGAAAGRAAPVWASGLRVVHDLAYLLGTSAGLGDLGRPGERLLA